MVVEDRGLPSSFPVPFIICAWCTALAMNLNINECCVLATITSRAMAMTRSTCCLRWFVVAVLRPVASEADEVVSGSTWWRTAPCDDRCASWCNGRRICRRHSNSTSQRLCAIAIHQLTTGSKHVALQWRHVVSYTHSLCTTWRLTPPPLLLLLQSATDANNWTQCNRVVNALPMERGHSGTRRLYLAMYVTTTFRAISQKRLNQIWLPKLAQTMILMEPGLSGLGLVLSP